MHYGKMSSQNATTSDVETNFDHISKFENFQLDLLVMIFFLLTMSKFMLKWNSNIKMKSQLQNEVNFDVKMQPSMSTYKFSCQNQFQHNLFQFYIGCKSSRTINFGISPTQSGPQSCENYNFINL